MADSIRVTVLTGARPSDKSGLRWGHLDGLLERLVRETHLNRIYGKLGANNRREAARKAKQLGLV